jgi:hypothetical protein
MSDLIGYFKMHSVLRIVEQNLPLPVKLELMDFSMEPCAETCALGPDALGIWSFEDKLLPLGTLSEQQRPNRVRFTPEGMPSFVEDLPEPISV